MNGKSVMSAYAESLTNAGETVVENDMDADVAVIWSVLFQGNMYGNKQVWEHYRKNNKPVIVLEVGVVKRNITWRCGINGITGDAYHGPINNPNDRFKQSGLQIQPWCDTKIGHKIQKRSIEIQKMF